MALLITTKKDLNEITKDKFGQKLDKLSKTIRLSFAEKIDKNKIQFSDNAEMNNRIKEELGSVKDHLLSKIREAKDFSFYNSLERYFQEYFKLIEFNDKQKLMSDDDYNTFEINIANLKQELSIVDEEINPVQFKGYTLRDIDKSELDNDKLTGVLLKQAYDDGFIDSYENKGRETFTGIKKLDDIKYIGGKEYYFSGKKYGAIHLEDSHDKNHPTPAPQTPAVEEEAKAEASPPPPAPPPTPRPTQEVSPPQPNKSAGFLFFIL